MVQIMNEINNMLNSERVASLLLTRTLVVSVATNVCLSNTVELQWLGHHWNHEKMFQTGVVRANEC